MANRTYTLAQLETAVQQAWGGNASATLTAAEVVNDALDWLANRHEWSWLLRPLSLNFVASQNYIALPADFKGMHSLVHNSSMSVLAEVPLQSILLRRANASIVVTNGFNYSYAITAAPQASATAEPTWRLELYPTPTTATTAAFTGVYTRIIPLLTGSTSLPDIPAQYHRLLKMVCRAMAVSQQTQEGSEDWRIVMDELEQAKASDGLVSGSLGSMVGTIHRCENDYDFPVRGSIIYPP